MTLKIQIKKKKANRKQNKTKKEKKRMSSQDPTQQPCEGQPPKVYIRNGIQNCGNSCFMNVILQMLLSIRPVACEIQSAESDNDMMKALTNVSKSIYSPQNRPALYRNAQLFYHSVVSVENSMFEKFQQADCHDLFLFLIDKLHSILRRNIVYRVSNENLDNRSIYYKSLLYQTVHISKDGYSAIQNEFQGVYASVFACQHCGHTDIRNEMFSSVQLHLSQQTNTLVSCMREFGTPETISDYLCERCNVRGGISKKMVIGVTPNTLVLQFKRFEYTQTGIRKIDSSIEYPVNVNLDNDIPDVMLTSRENTVVSNDYSLVAVVHHQGSYLGGHYFMEMTDPMSNKWIKCNDVLVTDTLIGIKPTSRLMSQTVYMLVYRKKK